jgi:hypothetical protein
MSSWLAQHMPVAQTWLCAIRSSINKNNNKNMEPTAKYILKKCELWCNNNYIRLTTHKPTKLAEMTETLIRNYCKISLRTLAQQQADSFMWGEDGSVLETVAQSASQEISMVQHLYVSPFHIHSTHYIPYTKITLKLSHNMFMVLNYV